MEIIAYPVYFKYTKDGVIAWNDYIPIATQGKNLEETLFMAKDAIELMAYDSFLNGEIFIDPKSSIGTDEKYDFKSYVIVDLNKYFRLESEKKKRKIVQYLKAWQKSQKKKGLIFLRF